LVSVENINNINNLYGLKNGDKVLCSVADWICNFLEKKGISNIPLGHIKGGDFMFGVDGKKEEYASTIELMFLSSDSIKVDDIEVIISGAITDTFYSKDLDYLIEHLYEIQKAKISTRENLKQVLHDPNELELVVIEAIKNQNILLSTQKVFYKDQPYIKECFIKMLNGEKIKYPKEYMKVINRLGFELEYDLLVLEQVLLKMKEDDMVYALSISPRTFRNHLFVSKAKELFHHFSYFKNRLIFILAENEYYAQTKKYNFLLDIFHELGVKLAIDKLGSNHTSFLYLRDLNIDVVRFDSYYAKNMKNINIIDGFNIMAHEKNVKTWIKKVEEKDIKKYAKEIGIDYIQGKYLAPLEIRDGE